MRVRHLNLTHPEHSGALQAPLAKSAGGWGVCKDKDDQPVFGSTEDPDYRRILSALRQVERRKEPGVRELLEKTPAQHRQSPGG